MKFKIPSVAIVFVLVAACGGSSEDPPGESASAATTTARRPSTSDAGTSGDGTPTRGACTASLGQELSQTHGRLDGFLVSIVPPTDRRCHADSTHLHLQVQMHGGVYDVAVNLDGLEAETNAALPGTPWAEGWHAGENLDYARDLGLHAGAFTVTGIDAVRQQVESALASANHVSIYATGYGPEGVHRVHRNDGRQDGAIVLDPLSPTAHVVAFRFDRQSGSF